MNALRAFQTNRHQRDSVRRLRTPDFTWDNARDALDSIFWKGLRGADRPGLYRRHFFGFYLKVRDVATALGMLFRGETVYVRSPQSRYEKIRDLQDLKEIHAVWGVQAAAKAAEEPPQLRRVA